MTRRSRKIRGNWTPCISIRNLPGKKGMHARATPLPKPPYYHTAVQGYSVDYSMSESLSRYEVCVEKSVVTLYPLLFLATCCFFAAVRLALYVNMLCDWNHFVFHLWSSVCGGEKPPNLKKARGSYGDTKPAKTNTYFRSFMGTSSQNLSKTKMSRAQIRSPETFF